jgi:RNA polymerase sigma-70 factor (ECF subfamily)
MQTAEELIPTRQSLLSRLKDWGDQEGWQAFFDTYWRLIYNAAIRSGLNDAEAQDVVQETVISVLKSMPTFAYDVERGSFKGWLLNLTRWRILDHLRMKHSRVQSGARDDRSPTETSEIERVPDPASLRLEETWDMEWEQNLVEAACERVKRKVDAKHYQIFDLYAFKQWPVSKVARTFGIHTGQVYLIKHRIGALVKKEISHLKQTPI